MPINLELCPAVTHVARILTVMIVTLVLERIYFTVNNTPSKSAFHSTCILADVHFCPFM